MRRKRLIGVFLIITALVIMLLPVPEAVAATPASGFVIKGGKLTSYKGSDKVVTVPDTVNTICESAFSGNDYIEKVILPNTVQSIEAYSFWDCDRLKTVQIGTSLKLIGDFAFTNCTGLESMTIPKGVRCIGIEAFSYCTGLETIYIPPEVTEISEDAFEGDYLLNILCEPGSYADRYAKDFYERQKKMAVYNGPTQIVISPNPKPEDVSGNDVGSSNGSGNGNGNGTGQSTTSVESVPEITVPERPGAEIGSTKVVANQAVVLMQNAGLPVVGSPGGENGLPAVSQDDSSLDSLENLLETIERTGVIPERMCYRDANLTEVILKEGVREIGRFAYARSGIRVLELPPGLEKIKYAAFYHCDDLAQAELPESVVSVEAKAFAHTPWLDAFLEGRGGTEGDYLISGGVLVAYRGTAEEVVIPEGVRVIAGEAFSGHGEIKRIVFPESLQGIDEKAFGGCDPEEIVYQGSAMDQDYVEEVVRMSSMSAPMSAGAGVGSRTWWIAVPMMLAGTFLALKKSV